MNTPTMNWDLSSYFTEFDGPEYREFRQALEGVVALLSARAAKLAPLDNSNIPEWEQVLLDFEKASAQYSHLASYVGALASCDARNEGYRREEARLSRLGAAFDKLGVQLTRAVRDVPDAAFDALKAQPSLAGCGYFLDRLREDACFSMSPELEELAADLSVDGIGAWGRLYDTLAGTLEFDMVFPDGRRERLPMSRRRSLMGDADRNIRRAAFEGGNAAWAKVADTAAAALNHISGTRLTLNERRGVQHFLDVALFQASISPKTLNALLEALNQRAGFAQELFRLKARLLRVERGAWYDLEAPLPFASQERLPWAKAIDLVHHAFAEAYPNLGSFFDDVVNNSWIDYEARDGKRPGAFCTGSRLTGESRVFMTFQGSLGDVSTLAHEVGHAYHNHVMRDLRVFERRYPMTLAESASTFAEQVLADGLLADPAIGDNERKVLLAEQLSEGVIFLLDIPVRYNFERALYTERAEGEVSVSRLCELMIQTQRSVFGDALADDGVDPYYWASKLHFFITGVTFYNFPYTFGYLLSRALFSAYKQQGHNFLKRYEHFLARTGSAPAQVVTKETLGWDLESTSFWTDAIDTLQDPLARFKQLESSLA